MGFAAVVAAIPLLAQCLLALATVVLVVVFRAAGGGATPLAQVLPLIVCLSLAYAALTDLLAFPLALEACGATPAGVVFVVLFLLLCPLLGGLFFQLDGPVLHCNWAITRETCLHPTKQVRAVQALGAVFVALLLVNFEVVAVHSSGLWAPDDAALPCILRLLPPPAAAAAPLSSADKVVALLLMNGMALLWLAGVPLMYWLLWRGAGGSAAVHVHVHHYLAALFLGTLAVGTHVWAFIVQLVAWGVLLQGAWASGVAPLLEPNVAGDGWRGCRA